MNVDAGLERPEVDRELWQRRDIRQALAGRDLATVFKLLRREGTSQRAIATLTGLAPSEVYEISRGRAEGRYRVDAKKLRRLETILGPRRGAL